MELSIDSLKGRTIKSTDGLYTDGVLNLYLQFDDGSSLVLVSGNTGIQQLEIQKSGNAINLLREPDQ
jgi:hypothetical protein